MKWFVKCLRNYANFRGRASCTEFWDFVLVFFLIVSVVTGAVLLCCDSRRYFLALFAFLPFLLPYLAVMVRRLHDVGRSGWWVGGYLLVYVVNWFVASASGRPDAAQWLADAELAGVMLQAVYLVLMLYWLCKRGDTAANAYGEPPLPDAGK